MLTTDFSPAFSYLMLITVMNPTHCIWPPCLTPGISAGDFSTLCYLESNAVATHRYQLSTETKERHICSRNRCLGPSKFEILYVFNSGKTYNIKISKLQAING